MKLLRILVKYDRTSMLLALRLAIKEYVRPLGGVMAIKKSNTTGRRIFHRVPLRTRFYAICFMCSMGNEDTMAASGWATGLKLFNASGSRSLHPVQHAGYFVWNRWLRVRFSIHGRSPLCKPV